MTFNFRRPTPKEMEAILEERQRMFQRFREVPIEGEMVEWRNRSYLVYPGVFWPHADSIALAEYYVVKPGESVLDLCTGSGNLALESAHKISDLYHSGYGFGPRVIAVDINPNAVRSARDNVLLHAVSPFMEVRESDGLRDVIPGEMFDVITGNLPFTDHPAGDLVEGTMYDPGLHVWRDFFGGIDSHLNPGGRIYLANANFGCIDEMFDLASDHRFNVRHIGTNVLEDPHREFYAFELTRMDE
ncbi:class I SAM-dependent methyltransferase [Candidatus Woesearchaeota archaeon]|nr:class I SAM-dependent methyltransferase [Candidatus Woesearchaeota archaeon]